MARSGTNHKGGRPPGKKSAKTLEKEKVLAEVRERIMRNAQRILDSQMSVARGQQFLYRVDKTKVIGPKGGISYRNEKPVLVTAEREIEAYLDGLAEGDVDDDKDPAAAYYYITTKEPNNMAIDSMMNRAFGKPTESVEVTGSNGTPLIDLSQAVREIISRQ